MLTHFIYEFICIRERYISRGVKASRIFDTMPQHVFSTMNEDYTMLQSMRDKMQGWVAGLIIALVILALGFWGISSYLSGGSANQNILVKFHGNQITTEELDVAYNRLRMQNQGQLPDTIAAVKAIKQQILQQLISQKLLASAAKSEGFMINQAQVNSVLMQIPAFQVNGQFSRDRFQEVIEQLLFTVPSFLDNLEATMYVNQVQSGMLGSAFVLNTEVDNNLALINQQRDFDYTIIPSIRAASKINITQTEIEQYYQNHQSDFMNPETVSLQYVVLSAAAMMKQVKPTEQALQQYYQTHLSQYTQPVRWHVAHILVKDAQQAQQIYQQAQAATTNFASLAQKHSQDLISAKDGGVLPWFSPGQLDPNFETAVAGLKVNQVSPPVKTRYGYEIIKLLAVQKENSQSYVSVKDQVTKAYLLDAAQKAFADQKEQLANLSFENPSTLAPIVKNLGLTIKTTESFTNQGGSTSLTKLPQVVAAAFSADVLAGNNSDLITIAPDQVLVLRVLEHQAAALSPLATVSSKIKNILFNKALKEFMQKLGDQVIDALKAGQGQSVVAKNHELNWHTVTKITRNSKGLDPLIIDQAFHLTPVTQDISVGGVSLGNHDFAVVVLKKIVEGQVSPKLAAGSAEQLTRAFGQTEYLEYVAYLHNKAKIKYPQPQ